MSIISSFTGLIWFVLTLIPLVFIQRFLHREIQAVLLIITRNPQLTIGLFSVLFFPGVVLHELSHFLMAKLLFVPIGSFSLVPQALKDGRLQLGYVETQQTDVARDSLIGAAPLLAGGLFVAYAAIYHLQLLPLWDALRNGQSDLFWSGITLLPQAKDFYVWLYLIFAVSSTMIPSTSDRHPWTTLGLVIAILLGLALLAGAGPWMLAYLAPPLNNFLNSVAALFALSIVIHAVMVVPFMLAHRLLVHVTGVDIAQEKTTSAKK
jgi:hypothetical protein